MQAGLSSSPALVVGPGLGSQDAGEALRRGCSGGRLRPGRPAGRQVPFRVPRARPPSQARLVSSLPKAGTQQQLGGDPGAWLPNAGHLQPGLPASRRLGDGNVGEETQDPRETMSMTR